MTNAMQNLPPELQARLAAVMAGKQQADPGLQAAAAAAAQMQQAQATELQMQQAAPPVPVQTQAPAPAPQAPPKAPSLVDLMLMVRRDIDALRQEVATLNAQVSAASQVNEAVGHAVGRMYQMFQPSEQAASAPTYSQNFQAQQVDDDSDY